MIDKIKVLIVDDSPFIREALRSILAQDEEIQVVGMARNGKEAIEAARKLKPNVITMDVTMPVMDGLEAIEQIMEETPVPIIVVSSMSVEVVVKALDIGALDFVSISQGIDEMAQDVIRKVKIASRIKALRRLRIKPLTMAARYAKSRLMKVVAVGVSTGGPQALQAVFSSLPPDLDAGILVVQHMSKGFIEGLAEWLRLNSHLNVKVAQAGDILRKGHVLLAPDGGHLKIDSLGKISIQEEAAGPALHVPSIDVMMKSVAESFRESAVGVLMTGMGHDGVEGMKAIRAGGGKTLAQDEASSVIFGMNRLAIESGCVDRIAPLEQIADEIVRCAE